VTRTRHGWLLAGGAFALITFLGWWLAPGGAAAVLGTVALCVWLAFTLPIVAWRLWRRLTYRVGVRLFLSYLLLGVTPFVFGLAMAAIALYILAGQYTSVRVGLDVAGYVEDVRAECVRVADALATDGPDVARSALEAMRTDPPPPWSALEWILVDAGRIDRSAGLDGVEVAWPRIGQEPRMVTTGERVFGVVAAGTPDRGVALLQPLDRPTSVAFSQGRWYQAVFVGGEGEDGGDGEVEVSASAGRDGAEVSLEAEDAAADELFGPWPRPTEPLLDRPFIWWFREPVGVLDLATGDQVDDVGMVILMRTSPRAVWDDFVLSRPELSEGLQAVIIGVAAFFLLVYAVALVIAASMIVSITRATSRLTRGAGLVAAGDLDHRIPVRRHDQLGDLSASFNSMTASVQSMLAEVGEKERLARELELAREIQRSLLPEAALRLGPVTLFAAFRPATEVGGDYFDVFPVDANRLLVAIGDVAGHGLSTGLLMASLKALLAALADEGYRGADLVRRVNDVFRSQRPERTIATLAVVDIDLRARRFEITNAGHPPALVIDRDGRVTEVGRGSIPLGSPLCRPSVADAAFDVGSRLVLYSDGVVEAPDPSGDPFGYDRLVDLLRRSAGSAPDAVIGQVLAEVEAHHGRPQPMDDITVLIVDGGAAPGDGG
jgi:sigma-B regulation protein RsbU (phosphoserine phosphatase)